MPRLQRFPRAHKSAIECGATHRNVRTTGVFPRGTRVIALLLFAVCWPLKAHAAELTVTWDPPSDGTTTGYILFYGTASHSYSEQVDVGNTTSYAVRNLLDGTTYYFAVRAYDAAGVTSDSSIEVSGTTAPAVPPGGTALAVPPGVTALALSANVLLPAGRHHRDVARDRYGRSRALRIPVGAL